MFDALPARYLLRIHRDLSSYLPPDRYRRFLAAWFVGNLVRAPMRRRLAERRHGFGMPRNLNITLTEKCNLKCGGCYAASYSRAGDMRPDQFRDLVGQARALGTRHIGILGGEPLLYRKMLPVIAENPDLAFRITTNGTRLDDEIVSFLEHNPHVLTFISLEGDAQATDAWRGDGVYAAVRQAMRALVDKRILFGFSVTLSQANRDQVESGAFLDEMKAAGCRFGAFFPYGPVGENPRPELVIPEPELRAILPRIEARAERLGLLIKVEGYEARPGSPFAFLNGPGCQAGQSVHITPDGHVEPCNGIQFNTGVSVFERPLVDVLAEGFHARIRQEVDANHGRCIAIYQPDRVLDAVEQHDAHPSHHRSRPVLEAWVGRSA